MKVIESDIIYYFDCDDTLVMWDNKYKNEDQSNTVCFSCYEAIEFLVPNFKNIQFLKKTKEEGGGVVVWSAGGWAWAKEVVETLGLEDYVDLVISKPTGYIDDLNCTEFMGTRYYWDIK